MDVKTRTGRLLLLAAGALLGLSCEAAADDSLAVRFLHAFGKEGDGPGEFRTPQALSLDPEGALYIADTGNNRIQKVSPTGALLGMVGGFGWSENQFQRPEDLFAENGLDLYIADYDNRRIIRYDRQLHWIDAYSYVAAAEKLSLGFPAGIALSIHGDLFIADAENRRILKVNALREAVQSFGDFAEGEGELSEPQKIALDGEDKIYVSDRQRGCIVVFDYFGNYLLEIGGGVLKEPAGLFVDNRGTLLVADSGRDQAVIFGRDGRFVAAIGDSGEKLGAMDNPADVAVKGDRMYLLDAGNNRVLVYQLQWLQVP
jgi:sugar lactone lactonase YvrE